MKWDVLSNVQRQEVERQMEVISRGAVEIIGRSDEAEGDEIGCNRSRAREAGNGPVSARSSRRAYRRLCRSVSSRNSDMKYSSSLGTLPAESEIRQANPKRVATVGRRC